MVCSLVLYRTVPCCPELLEDNDSILFIQVPRAWSKDGLKTCASNKTKLIISTEYTNETDEDMVDCFQYQYVYVCVYQYVCHPSRENL